MKVELDLTKTILLAGLAFWISLIAFNNATDPGTNIDLLGRMLTMEAIKDNPTMGNGLEWRAWPQSLAAPLLVVVIILQGAIAALLWRAAIMFARHLFQAQAGEIPTRQIRAANLGLAAFLSLWFFFLCGGLWFGYWMHLGPVQGVHFTLLIVSVLVLLFVNYVPQPFPAAVVTGTGVTHEREWNIMPPTNGVYVDNGVHADNGVHTEQVTR
ncbi:MAG: DUF2165 family protein [Chloroflexaceae bacterium]